MTKKQTITETPIKTLYEELQISHNGIPVYVAINYKTMTLSLIERDGKQKNWLFCGRGTSYKQWWTSILEAMQLAMDIGFERLRKREDENTADLVEKTTRLMVNMQ